MEKITAKDNEKIKRYAKILSSKKYRDELCLFAIEGVKLFKEAKRCSVEIEQIFVTEKFLNRFGEDFFADENCEVYQISEAVENKIASSLTPQGIYAICKKLDKPLKLDKIENNGCFVALWNLQDPGNVGTIFRVADAMGLSGVILSENCCDVYNMKTVRSAMGSIFRMPFLITDMSEFLVSKKLTSYAAVVDSDAEKLSDIKFKNNSVIVIGNEGNGLSPEQVSVCDRRITIPMKGSAESLNAAMAATILIWEMAKGE